MTQYLKQPGEIHIAPDFKDMTIDHVPSGYYRIAFCDKRGFYLAQVDALQVADKVYGNLLEHLPRIEAAFAEQTDKPLSVMLEGLKGSGKSLLMKTLAKRFVENEGGIVLLCNTPFVGDDYFQFLQKISQKKIVLMDEFDKVYIDKDRRNNILTLLDGNFASHTMFILTMNAGLSSGNFEYFHNRPGRVMFNIKFKGVPIEAIQAYAEDHLTDKTKVAEVVQFVKRFTDFNMDMLSKLVNEINYCPSSSLESIAEYLNVKPDLTLDDIYFNVQYLRNGVDLTKHMMTNNTDRDFKRLLKVIGNPTESVTLNFMMNCSTTWNTKENRLFDQNIDGLKCPDIERGAIVQISRGNKQFVQAFDEYLYSSEVERTQDPTTGVITLTTKSDEGNGWVLHLTPQIAKRYNYAF